VESYNENTLQNQNMINNSTIIAESAVKKRTKRYHSDDGGQSRSNSSKRVHPYKRPASSTGKTSQSGESAASLALPQARQKTAVLMANKQRLEKEAALEFANALLDWIETADLSQSSEEGQQIHPSHPQNGAVHGADQHTADVTVAEDNIASNGEVLQSNAVPTNDTVQRHEEHNYLEFIPSSPSTVSVESLSSWFDSESSPPSSACSTPEPTDDTQCTTPMFRFQPMLHDSIHYVEYAKHYEHDMNADAHLGMMPVYNNAPAFSL